MRRLLTSVALVAALSLPISIGMAVDSGSAFAHAGITCSGISGNVNNPTPPGSPSAVADRRPARVTPPR